MAQGIHLLLSSNMTLSHFNSLLPRSWHHALYFLLIGFDEGKGYFILRIRSHYSNIPSTIGPECPRKSNTVNQAGDHQLYQKRAQSMGDVPTLHKQKNRHNRNPQNYG